jgi:hypothetical protein
MVDKTYGHLARGYAKRARERLNQRPSLVTAESVQEGQR